MLHCIIISDLIEAVAVGPSLYVQQRQYLFSLRVFSPGIRDEEPLVIHQTPQTQDEALHQAFTRFRTFHLRNPLESNVLAFPNAFDFNWAVGTRATKFAVFVIDIFRFQSSLLSFQGGVILDTDDSTTILT